MSKGNLAKLFHQQAIAEWRTIGLPKMEEWPPEWDTIYFKTYPRLDSVKLAPALPLEASIDTTLSTRKTTRSFDPSASLSFSQLSTILLKSAGLKSSSETELSKKRYYPSAGSRYPLEIYVMAERVEGLDAGIYHFNVRDASLELLIGEKGGHDFRELLGYAWSKNFSAAIAITAVWERNFMKYRDFGYRLVCLEAGHLSQNIHLTSAALSLSSSSLAGFNEVKLDNLLDLDPAVESSMYVNVLGKESIKTEHADVF